MPEVDCTTPVYASVDMGGTSIKCALADASGSVACSRSIPTQSYEGPESVLRRIAGLVADLGHGRSANTMAFFGLGTDMDGGVAVDVKPRLGPLGAAGELGHQIVVPDGPKCVCGVCGVCGCLETVASRPAIAAQGVGLLLSGLASRLHEFVGGDASRVTTRTMAASRWR